MRSGKMTVPRIRDDQLPGIIQAIQRFGSFEDGIFKSIAGIADHKHRNFEDRQAVVKRS